MPEYTIYTSRDTAGNLGASAWAVVIQDPNGKAKKLSGGAKNSTLNKMEISAVVHAIEALPKKATAKVYIHSKYIQNAITTWMEKWKASYWRASRGKPLPAREFWVRLDTALKGRTITWIWEPIKDQQDHPNYLVAKKLATEKMESYRRM